MATQFFGKAKITEVALINGDNGEGWMSVMASASDGSFQYKQCLATNGETATAVQQLGLWAMAHNNEVSLGIDENNRIITFGIFRP